MVIQPNLGNLREGSDSLCETHRHTQAVLLLWVWGRKKLQFPQQKASKHIESVYAGEQFTIGHFKVKLKQIHRKAKPRGSAVCRHELQGSTNSVKDTQEKRTIDRESRWCFRCIALQQRLGCGKPALCLQHVGPSRTFRLQLQVSRDSQAEALSGRFQRAVNRR